MCVARIFPHIVRHGLCLSFFVFISCANYYQQNLDFNKEFEKGDLHQALQSLEKKQREGQGKNRFIYFANNGLLHAILGDYEESNAYFEKAFLFGEDFRVNYFNEAGAYLVNPMFSVYRGEDHEHLMVLYFKALNYLKLNQPENALVECRRLNIRLQQLTDKYSSEDKWQRDAFIHNLMGIIYESVRDYNNAFIAYRNAYDIYHNEYTRMFNVAPPEQLKRDLLNCAWHTGFTDEFEKYKAEFGLEEYTVPAPQSELVFFWHNGLAPVKDEWSVNFVIRGGPNNQIAFINNELGVNFPYTVNEDKDRKDLSDLEIFRVAFPKYVERPEYYKSGQLKKDGVTYPLERAENISGIAFQSLRQRMMEEFAKGLLRAALKKAAEHGVKKENDNLGALIGIMNAITEKADTRNWQTLPHSIFYTRVPLNEGKNDIQFSLYTDQGKPADYSFTYTAQRGHTLFHTFSSLESFASFSRWY